MGQKEKETRENNRGRRKGSRAEKGWENEGEKQREGGK